MLNIGDVRIEHPFTQAALSGYSDRAMRRVARMHGASYTVNEVVLDKSVVHESDWQKQLLSVEPDEHPVGAQLMGADPDAFAVAARLLSDAGYDVIDINFGCPVPKALSRCRGGYLLSDPAAALEIVKRTVEAVGGDRPVTLKMRRGIDGTRDSKRSFFAILDGAFSAGVSAVTVHGRTVEQRYKGPADWDFIARVKEHLGDRVVLGSGDLLSARDCIDMIARTGVDGVTIARGALGNPWIFNQCRALAAGETDLRPPTLVEQRSTLAFHFAESVRLHGAGNVGKLIVKLAIKYGRMHPRPRRVREAFAAAQTVEAFHAVLDRWYAAERADDV